MQNTIQHLVLFDSDCIFCSKAIRIFLAFDTKEKFKIANLNYIKSNPNILDSSIQIPENTIIYINEDQVYFKSEAIKKILLELDTPFKFFALVLFIIPKKLADFIYDIIAKNRTKLFKQNDSCAVLSQDMLKRYIH